jgi:hypothetical protein
VLTLTKAALHAERPSGIVDDDHCVRTVGLAGAAQILDLVSGAKHSIIEHWVFRSEPWAFCIEHCALPRIFAT